MRFATYALPLIRTRQQCFSSAQQSRVDIVARIPIDAGAINVITRNSSRMLLTLVPLCSANVSLHTRCYLRLDSGTAERPLATRVASPVAKDSYVPGLRPGKR